MIIPDPKWEMPDLLEPGRKPVCPVVIDRNHPLASGLNAYYLFNSEKKDLVGGGTYALYNNSGSSYEDGVYEGGAGSIQQTPVANSVCSIRLIAGDRKLNVTDSLDRTYFADVHSLNGKVTLAFNESYKSYGIRIAFSLSGLNVRTNQLGASQTSVLAAANLTPDDRYRIAFTFGRDGRPLACINGSIYKGGNVHIAPDATATLNLNILNNFWSAPFQGVAYSYGVWMRSMPESELMELARDPYQMLVPA